MSRVCGRMRLGKKRGLVVLVNLGKEEVDDGVGLGKCRRGREWWGRFGKGV